MRELRQISLITWTQLSVVVLLINCDAPSAKTLVLVFPKDFRGLVTIRSHVPNGSELERQGSQAILNIPKKGVIELKGGDPTQNWHIMKACYSDGNPIEIDSIHNEMPNNAVGLRSLGLNKEGTESYYVLGDFEDYAKGFKAVNGFDLPQDK